MQQVFAHPLPDAWSAPELVQDSIIADGVELHRVGVATKSPAGEEITGAAVEVGYAPVARGYFELLERVSTLEAIAAHAPLPVRNAAGDLDGSSTSPGDLFVESDDPGRWRYARSNGVAIHDSWGSACERAYFELVERDRVLRAWYGETRPVPMKLPPGTSFDRLQSYDVLASLFPAAPGVTLGLDVAVVGVFGFPKREGLPLLLGYGARKTQSDALEAAIRESLQALGFLWGESLPSERPELGPSPGAHVEAMLYPPQHDRLRSWLRDGHERFAAGCPGNQPRGEVVFNDLTPSWLRGLFVAKASCPQARPLAFGESPFVQHLPADLRAHPIP